jgi:hypothetical protein
LFFAIRGSDVLFILSLPSRVSPRTTSNNTLEHQILYLCSLFSPSLLLHLPDLCNHSENLSDSSIPVSLLLSTFPPLVSPHTILHSSPFDDHPPTSALAIPQHASDLLSIASSSIATQIISFKMPAALTDTQNRYLAMAWLCIDAEPKVNTHISFSQYHPTISRIPHMISHGGPKLTCLLTHS